VARHQQYKAAELKAALAVYELYRRQRRPDEGKARLAEICDSFVGGVDTPELKAARRMLAG
jgi:hypothetical protein